MDHEPIESRRPKLHRFAVVVDDDSNPMWAFIEAVPALRATRAQSARFRR